MRRMATITTLIRDPGCPDRVPTNRLHEPQHRRSVEARGDGVAGRGQATGRADVRGTRGEGMRRGRDVGLDIRSLLSHNSVSASASDVRPRLNSPSRR